MSLRQPVNEETLTNRMFP